MKIFLGILIGLLVAIGIAVGAAYMAFGSFADVGDRDKSKDITQSFEFADFDALEIAGVYELNVKVGEDFSVSVSGAPEAMEKMDVSVEGGTLRLDHDHTDPVHGKHRWRNIGMTANITMPALKEIDISGIVEGKVSGVAASDFEIDMSGIGELEISGTCDALSASFSGIGELDAQSLECSAVRVDLSGIGEAEVYASQSVDADISGIGSINVYGSPSNVDKDSGLLSTITVK